MPEIRIVLNIEVDGSALPDMPVIVRQVYKEFANPSLTTVADNNTTSYHQIAAATMPAMNFFYLQTDQALNLQFNQSGSANPVPLLAGSIVLIMSPNLTQGTPANNVTYNTPGANAASLNVIVAGT